MEELQCALLGFHSASLPFEILKDSPCDAGVTGTFSQLHPSERSLVGEVLPLGEMCQTLRALATDFAVGRTDGLYISAIASAVVQILRSYEESVRAAVTPSSVVSLRPTYFLAFSLIMEMVQQQKNADLLLVTIQSFLSNREIPQKFRLWMGEAVWMSLLYTIGHYVAHGVVLHGRRDFFISVKSKGGKEDHTLHSDLLPHGIPMELGLLILSVGKERRVLLSDAESHGKEYLEQLALGAQDEAADAVFRAIYHPSLCVNGFLVVDELETRVEETHALWSKALWLKVSKQVDLRKHIDAMRAMFLCHRGDFWHTFVETAFSTFVDDTISRSTVTEAVVNRTAADAFAYALEMSGLGGVRVFERFSTFVRLPIEAEEGEGSGTLRSIEDTARAILSCMRGLGLHYVPPRGLQLVVSPKAMEYYQRIFSFHIVRRFSLHALHSVRGLFSEALLTNKNPSPELRRAFAIMQLLLFLQTTLGYYLQVDVIVLRNAELDKAMAKCKSVQDAKRCLDRYVWHITEGSFIAEGSNALFSACEALFQCSFALYVLCKRYRLVSWAVEGSRIPIEVLAALAALETRVHQEIIAAFTGHLSGSSTRGNERALWARLDFNRFLSAGLYGGPSTVFQQPQRPVPSRSLSSSLKSLRGPTQSRLRGERTTKGTSSPTPKAGHR
ncbi:Spc97 / Spc98 family, putative [Trypanosoma equiperdum]|uniref:Spindle pole body component n=1 Tax=Trypanosoma equiperdum TaxID=5694 RepID=A0A1G4IHG4_TRYEQ|nr:Spc97 / Spc98 family, putative [Trypanosoma equiperdum]